MSLVRDAEQRLFVDAAAEFFARQQLAANRGGAGDSLDTEWSELTAQLSAAALPLPEELGGGGSWREVGIVLEQAGRALSSLPYLSIMAAVRVLQVLDARDELAAVASGARVLLAVPASTFTAATPTVSWNGDRVVGEVRAVLDAEHADEFLVPVRSDAGVDLVAVARGAVQVVGRAGLDLTRTFGDLTFDDAPVRRILVTAADPARRVSVADALDAGLLLAAIGVAADAVGGADRCLQLTVDYVKIREQFGRSIGSLQAVKHALADVTRTLEPARAAVRDALDTVSAGGDDLARRASVARLAAVEAYAQAAGAAVQLHGAIGFTWEHELQRHLKRAVTSRALFGYARQHRDVLARCLVDDLRRAEGGSSLLAPLHPPAVDEDSVAVGDVRGDDGERRLDRLRREVREWLADNPAAGSEPLTAHEPMSYPAQSAEWLAALRSGRWLCLSWPVEYGGRGLAPAEVAAVDEEFARAGIIRPRLGMGERLVAPAILAHGTSDQKQRLLPPILSGTVRYCQGFSEPEAGSDLARIGTRGRIEGDELVMDGRKIWQSGASSATSIFVLCRTDPNASRHHGLSYVLVPMADNQVTVEPIRMMTGDWGFASVRFDGARAPLSDVIGGLGAGWSVAMTTLGAERAGEAATQFLGYREELLHLGRELGLDTVHRAIDAVVPAPLVEAYLRVELMRSSGRYIAQALAAGENPAAALAVDKLNWSEYHAWFGEMAVDQLGLDGVLLPPGDGYPLTPFQRVLLESRGRRIARGTNQIQRNIIAERVLGLPR